MCFYWVNSRRRFCLGNDWAIAQHSAMAPLSVGTTLLVNARKVVPMSYFSLRGWGWGYDIPGNVSNRNSHKE